tara:strand:+ start:1001 stop:1309 length:309 start_codon:yes stop_codon:yes gene_type:complete
MRKYDKVVIKKSTNPKKKMMATFSDSSNPNSRSKTTHFGSSGYSDFPTHKDEERRQLYLNRHRKRERWDKPTTAGSLSRWILWNKSSRSASISDYKKRFNLK